MASTAECKALLDKDPQTADKGGGGWKRLSKRNSPDGVERIFASKDESFYARLVEVGYTLIVERVGEKLEDVDVHRPQEIKMRVPVNLFEMFPPELGMEEDEMREIVGLAENADLVEVIAAWREDFTGRFIYGLTADDDEDEDEDEEDSNSYYNGELSFQFGYETSDGWLCDQHHESYTHALPLIFPELADRMSINDSEGSHSVSVESLKEAKKLWRKMSKRFEEVGAVVLHTPTDRPGSGMVLAGDSLLGGEGSKSKPRGP